jgi:hypothetical protein
MAAPVSLLSPVSAHVHLDPTSLMRLRTESLTLTRILKIGDQRLAQKTGRLRPKIQKITPQRLRDVSLTLGNVARIFFKPDIAHRDGTGWLGS